MTLDDWTLRLVTAAPHEDVRDGDRTTLWTVPAGTIASARIVAKAAGVLAGVEVAREVFRQVDESLTFTAEAEDGAAVEPGQVIVRLQGPAAAVLSGERVALNFLQRLSGVATLTRSYVECVAGTGVQILDTRKTTPGLRMLEKAAVRAGGGTNHRTGLFDMVLIKENHIAAAGGIAAAVAAVREQNREGLRVEVEVRDVEELREALAAGVDVVLLDNMDPPRLREAVAVARDVDPAVLLEASGGIDLNTVRDVALTGVDMISVGALTHSAAALDLSLLIDR